MNRSPLGLALVLSAVFAVAGPLSGNAQWHVLVAGDQRQARPPKNITGGTPIKPGDRWPTDQKFRWLIGDPEIPERIGKQSAAGKIVGLQLNCGDGGEIWLGDEIQTRFDNDHPGIVAVTNRAVPGTPVRIAVQVYGKVQGGDKFDQANWVIIDPKRAEGWLELTVDSKQDLGKVPNGIVGLSQGGGMADYEEATARKLREGGFKWFRMDNVFTGVLKKNKQEELTCDWADFDKRIDFIQKIGADDHAELSKTQSGKLERTNFTFEETLAPNSVTLIELVPNR